MCSNSLISALAIVAFVSVFVAHGSIYFKKGGPKEQMAEEKKALKVGMQLKMLMWCHGNLTKQQEKELETFFLERSCIDEEMAKVSNTLIRTNHLRV